MNDVPVAITIDGEAPEHEHDSSGWTVPYMFEMIERKLELAKHPEREIWLRCKFDLTYGYPANFHCVERTSIWPDWYWEVTRFETVGVAAPRLRRLDEFHFRGLTPRG